MITFVIVNDNEIIVITSNYIYQTKISSMFSMSRIVGALLVLFTAAACEDNSAQNDKLNEVNDVAKSGTWRITYYYDTDKEETTNFAGYNFTFGSDGKLTVTNGTNTYTGTWSISDSNSNDDTYDDLNFNIAFTTPPAFADLTDDWDIMEVAATRIKLIDVSGGNGGTDYLTFEKN